MSNTLFRRCAVGAVALALALGATGCGAEDSAAAHAPAGRSGERAAGTGASKASKAEESTARVPVLVQDRLEEMVLDERDLPGVSVNTIGAGTDGVGDGVVRPVPDRASRPSACGPVNSALAGGSRFTPVASVMRMAQSKGHLVTFYLVSYQQADAVHVVDELRAALRTCTAFTSSTSSAGYEKVSPTGDPAAGDEGVSFRLTELFNTPGRDDAIPIPKSVVVIRSGSTIAVFNAMDTLPEPGHYPKVSTDIVTAQVNVLDAGAHATR
ncbi:hypothetical protein AB0F46_10225 [Streptomyces sp. NPDC026665]|uniref:hypothetical protein n=1 Tax=Streptomyces sp. NPDC026665 TaxID=3154798 RepID=UPI0033F9C91C